VFKIVKPAFDIGIWLGTKISDAILDALDNDTQKPPTRLADDINRVFFDLTYAGRPA
jgi:hypothetical protein